MVNRIILTHGDLDGMVSGILLLQAIGTETPVRITNGARLVDALNTLDTSEVTDVYLAELPLVATLAGTVHETLRRIMNAGCALHLYDHHFGWEPHVDVFTTFHVDTRRTTAAVLVW